MTIIIIIIIIIIITVIGYLNEVKMASATTTVACDHALSLCLYNLFSGGGHDTFLLQITCKKARIWTFF